jgi:cob(I)alamin adenosyltransferase
MAGRVLIFAGPGKGKTTAALGAALRAAGHGAKVLVVQFVKSHECGEHVAARELAPLVEIRRMGEGFLPEDEGRAMDAARAAAGGALEEARTALAGGEYGLVVLDEVLYAVRRGLVEPQAVREAVQGRHPDAHVILTGRGPWEAFADLADTITRMESVRHAHDAGTEATPGIEF